jgi:hypothetical protein
MHLSLGIFFLSCLATLALAGTLAFGDPRADWFASVAPLLCVLGILIALDRLHAGTRMSREKWRELGIAVLVGTLLCGVVFANVTPEFRILADETNLLSTSHALHSHLQLLNITEQLNFFDSTHIVSAEPAHRPALYPILTALLHYCSGFRWSNGIVLNFMVGVASLTLLQLALARVGGRALSLLGAVLLTSAPLFQLNITSSGFDALNSLMIMAVYFQLYRFLQQPNARQAELLLILGILAAQARYETAVLLLPIGLALLLHARTLLRQRYSSALVLMPLLALPVVWQKMVAESFANAGDAPEQAFAIGNIAGNAMQAALFFFKADTPGLPVQLWMSYAALAGAALLLWQARRQDVTALWFLALAALGQLLLSLAHFAYYTGNYQLPWISRLAQIHLVWLVPLAAIALLHALRLSRIKPVYACGLAALVLVHGLVIGQANVQGKNLLLYREFKQAKDFLTANYPPEHSLVINERSGMYAALGYSALYPHNASAREGDLKVNLENGLFQHILQLSVENFGTKSPALALGSLPYREVGRFQINGAQYLIVREYEQASPQQAAH